MPRRYDEEEIKQRLNETHDLNSRIQTQDLCTKVEFSSIRLSKSCFTCLVNRYAVDTETNTVVRTEILSN